MTTDSRPPDSDDNVSQFPKRMLTVADIIRQANEIATDIVNASALPSRFLGKNRNPTIVQMHDHDHMSFEAIGRIYGITRQRAHQICTRTRKKQREEA